MLSPDPAEPGEGEGRSISGNLSRRQIARSNVRQVPQADLARRARCQLVPVCDLELVHAASLRSARGHLGHPFVLSVLAPLFALLAGAIPPARDFWTEFSVAIGYAGLAMMGLQFGLTAPFRYVTDPWARI